MTPYNINVVKPEDDESTPSITNALHLQSDCGHHFGAPFLDKYGSPSNLNAYSYPFDSSHNHDFVHNAQPARPQLTHLSTGSSLYSFDMQHDESSDSNRTRPFSLLETGTLTNEEFSSIYPSEWRVVNGAFVSSNSSSPFMGDDPSPISQGLSPLTPLTPLLNVEPSPTSSNFPSPGSQGSSNGEFLHISTSPSLRTRSISDTTAVLHASPMSLHPSLYPDTQAQYFSQYRPDAQVPAPQMYAQVQHQACSPSDLSVPIHHLANSIPPYASSSTSYYTSAPVPLSDPVPTPPLDVQTAEALFVSGELSLPGPQIPQTVYKPHTASDLRRYVEDVELNLPVYFFMQNPLQAGMPLRDALTNKFVRLMGRDDPMFEGRGPSISVRLVWEGYSPWSRQIPTRDFKSPPGPITRAKLAKNMAKTMQRFIEEHQDCAFEPGASTCWRVGPGRIMIDDLLLVSLHHVSKGSWQANLCLNRPLAMPRISSLTL